MWWLPRVSIPGPLAPQPRDPPGQATVCRWPAKWFCDHLLPLELLLINPNPRARKAYLTRNRASNNVVATPGFDPPTSRTPAPWTSRPSHRVSPPGSRFGGHLSVPVMTQSHLMHFLSSILRRSRRLGLKHDCCWLYFQLSKSYSGIKWLQ